MRALTVLSALTLLAACGVGPFTQRESPAGPAPDVRTAALDTPRAEARPTPAALRPPAGRTVEALDTTTPAERQAAAAAPAAAGRELGRTVASLGDPAQPGFWMATPLVQVPTPGRVTHTASGASVRLELRPSGAMAGSGSQLSLAAFRALDLPVTSLPELLVSAE